MNDEMMLFDAINNLITNIEQNDFISIEYIYEELVDMLLNYEGDFNIEKSGETR